MQENKTIDLSRWQSKVWKDTHRFIVIDVGRRGGKALSLNTLILTKDGYKEMGDLTEGNIVYDENGNETKIISVSEIFYNHNCYEITFSNGEKIIADAEHLWYIEDKKYRKNVVRSTVKGTKFTPYIKTTEELSKDFILKRSDQRIENNYSIPISKSLKFKNKKKELLLDPYILGAWLGDGTTDDSAITIFEEEIKNNFKKKGIILKQKGNKAITYVMYKKNKYLEKKIRQSNGTTYRDILKKLGVLGNKHIPLEYLYLGIGKRKELLCGLMDTDGTIDKNGKCEFSVVNKKLASDVLFLIRSLGIKANMCECDAKLYGRYICPRYRIIFSPNFNCFNIQYKSNRYKKIRKSDTKRFFIENIKKVDSVPTKCIMVDSPSHLYLVGKSLIPTHNSTISALKIAAFVQNHTNSIVYYVSPTYQQSKSIMWEMLKQYIPSHWIKSSKESELKLELTNGARIELKGADTEPDRLRGVRIDFLICDEVAYFKNWEVVWNNVLRPTLIDSKGSAIFISTPSGYNHFYKLYMNGFDEKMKDEWSSYKFTSYDNEYLDRKEIDKARDDSDEDTFAQEYLGEFKKYTGMVFKYFSREKHFIPPVEFGDNWTYYRGIDFGWTNPSAVPFIAVSPDGKVYIYDLIYQSGLTTPDLALLIKQKSVGRGFNGTWGDSAQASDIAEIQKYGINVQAVSKSVSKGGMENEDFVSYKIRKMNQLIKSNKLFIFNHLDKALFEIENYQYKEVRVGNEMKERPAKINDHFLDALSYVIINLPEYYEPSFVESSESKMETPAWAFNMPKWSGARLK
jgi:hypothetical protein